MTRSILLGTIAAFALTAPVQAERGGGRGKAEAQAQQAPQGHGKGGGGEQRGRAERPQQEQRVRMERPQQEQRVRMERPQQEQRVRMERPQQEQRVRMERPQREQRVRMERPQQEQRVRMERPQREQRVRMERPQQEQRVRMERPQREQRVRMERPQQEQRARMERPQREQRVRMERPMREQRARVERQDRQQRPAFERQQRRATAFEQRDQRVAERQLRREQRQAERLDRIQNRDARRAERIAAPDGGERLRDARFAAQPVQQRMHSPAIAVGQRLAQPLSRDWSGDLAGQRFLGFGEYAPQYAYDYNPADGYLYQVDPRSNLVMGHYPLLGGAFSVGQPLPIGYQDYNVPYAYQDLYYDTPNSLYRFGDGAIYRVDPTTQLIQAVVALLTGQSLGVGQMLPTGYDAYNVPFAYRNDYFDTPAAWYRYDDGFIYQVDPVTRRIVRVIPAGYGSNYAVGYPAPAYASYGGYGAYAGYPSFQVPYDYRPLYYRQPGYDYQFANGGIYQVDPATRLISALVALVTGTSLNVGQMLPAGYDAYNVPYAYRDRYYDTPDSWYRYDDGYIYEVDPRTRMVEAMVPVSYGGYQVGYPVPADYPGYAVPAAYQDLYYAEPGYDYRYVDGGIYGVDPRTQTVQSLAALLTGQNLGVGQMLPAGYDAYNLPFAYRDRYHDSDRSLYRYADGRILQVDPQTRLIQAVIDAIV